MSNSNDVNGTSNKHKSSKDGIRKKKDNPDKKKSFILGDSMIKQTKGWELSSKIDNKHSNYVRSFSSVKARSMKDYVKPYVREENPDHIIMYVRTNGLNSENKPGGAAESIVNLVEGMFSEKRKVVVSGIIPQK